MFLLPLTHYEKVLVVNFSLSSHNQWFLTKNEGSELNHTSRVSENIHVI